jgi:ABC-type glycerol-3-phosphate transport system substrate-binding protein
MRKTLLALALGLMTLVAAACGGTDTGSPGASDILESVAPVESPSDMVESPSAESPAAS